MESIPARNLQAARAALVRQAVLPARLELARRLELDLIPQVVRVERAGLLVRRVEQVELELELAQGLG